MFVCCMFILSGAVACRDTTNVPQEASTPNLSLSQTMGVSLHSNAALGPGSDVSVAEEASAESLARALAIALGDRTLRQSVKAALATSAGNEHKLHFATFMQGRGAAIAEAISRRARITPQDLAAKVAEVRDLELYMPVEGHRELWTGEEEIRVAVGLDESSPPVAFNSAGEREVLYLDAPPASPVLVLTTTETDFANQDALNEQGLAAIPCRVEESETLAAAARRCVPPTREPAISSAPAPANPAVSLLITPDTTLASDPDLYGLYAASFTLVDKHEPWWRGTPELELHTFAKRSASDGSAHMFQCSGEHANDAGGYQPGNRSQSYVYDQNGKFWSGEVLVLDPAQVDTAQKAEFDGFNVSVWEDDDASCKIKQKSSRDYFKTAVSATSSVVKGAVAVGAKGKPNYATLAENFGSLLSDLYDLLVGGDDYVGVLVSIDSTPYKGQYVESHIIYDHASYAGRANIFLKTTTHTSPTPGPVATVEVSPSIDTLYYGAGIGLVAYAYDAFGVGVPNKLATWQSSNTSIATVTSSGFVTSKGIGTATITATIDGVSQNVPITVRTTPSTVLSNVSISGPWDMRPYAQCYFSVSKSGGTAPFTYSWTVDGAPVSSSSGYFATAPASGHFTLEITVTDYTGDHLTAYQDVDVSSSAPVCAQ